MWSAEKLLVPFHCDCDWLICSRCRMGVDKPRLLKSEHRRADAPRVLVTICDGESIVGGFDGHSEREGTFSASTAPVAGRDQLAVLFSRLLSRAIAEGLSRTNRMPRLCGAMPAAHPPLLPSRMKKDM